MSTKLFTHSLTSRRSTPSPRLPCGVSTRRTTHPVAACRTSPHPTSPLFRIHKTLQLPPRFTSNYKPTPQFRLFRVHETLHPPFRRISNYFPTCRTRVNPCVVSTRHFTHPFASPPTTPQLPLFSVHETLHPPSRYTSNYKPTPQFRLFHVQVRDSLLTPSPSLQLRAHPTSQRNRLAWLHRRRGLASDGVRYASAQSSVGRRFRIVTKLRLEWYGGVFVLLQQRSKHPREIVITPEVSTSSFEFR